MSIATETDQHSCKPPFLRRVRIRGYKSISFCDVSLEPLTVLVGQNASGKSNFVDALAFLVDLIKMRAIEAVDIRGGWPVIQCRDRKKQSVEFEIEASLGGYQPTLEARYAFELSEVGRGRVTISKEALLLSLPGGSVKCGYDVRESDIAWIGDEQEWRKLRAYPGDLSSHPSHFLRHPNPDRLLLSALGSQPIVELSEELRASHVHCFSPAAMRQPKPITGSPDLAFDGSNLARAIEGIREIDPGTIERIASYLSSIVPGIEGLGTIKIEEYEMIQFRMSRGDAKPEVFGASSMSDGTLQALATLVAAFQIYLPTNASGFTAIEEPETSLHPSAVRALMAALDEATLRKQILLTTHSSVLLDVPEIQTKNVRIVEMVDGETLITPMDEASTSIVRDRFGTIGDLERDRQLVLNLDDLDRQKALAQQEPVMP
ncbi:MAG TPA: AAA family ATPase [Urbifossiella sp.]